IPGSRADSDAERAVTALYARHYAPLVRLAALLVRDVATAEEVVQDSFIALHASWPRLRDSDAALSYLRQSVVNRSRSVLRRRTVEDRNQPNRGQPPRRARHRIPARGTKPRRHDSGTHTTHGKSRPSAALPSDRSRDWHRPRLI